MSRTIRKCRDTYKMVRDGKQRHRCKCNWCINMNYRDRYYLTTKEFNDMKIFFNST